MGVLYTKAGKYSENMGVLYTKTGKYSENMCVLYTKAGKYSENMGVLYTKAGKYSENMGVFCSFHYFLLSELFSVSFPAFHITLAINRTVKSNC